MQVSDLFEGDSQTLSLLNKSKLWHLPTDKLSTISLRAFIGQCAMQGSEIEARQEVLLLLERLLDQMVRGNLPYDSIVTFSPGWRRPAPLTTSDYCRALLEIPLPRRKALLYGLEIEYDLALEEIVELTWKDAYQLAGGSVVAQNIVNGLTTHLKLNYAFWEWMDDARAMPLVGLQTTFGEISGRMSWEDYRKAYRGALRVFPEADAVRVAEVLKIAP